MQTTYNIGDIITTNKRINFGSKMAQDLISLPANSIGTIIRIKGEECTINIDGQLFTLNIKQITRIPKEDIC